MTLIPLILLLAFVQDTPELKPEVRASMLLGARSAQVQRALPILNQVVLVPDEATYLDEISQWSPMARWPVLFEQEPFASQFIRKFEPEKIWRRQSIGKLDVQTIGEQMQHVVASAWGGGASIEESLHEVGLPPLGIVLTTVDDPARTGAVALAAGRGQLLKYISSEWGTTNEILGSAKTTQLLNEIDAVLASTGVNYKEVGDTIDAITICQTLPARVTFDVARQNPVAVSDVIGRDLSGERFAWTGWLFGNKARSAYVAMSSLFLSREQYWFCNTYPNQGGWGRYAQGNLPTILPKLGIKLDTIDGTLAAMQEAGKGGVTSDIVFFTTKGNADFLEMSDTRTSPTWLPILNTPSVLYFVHSWSLKNPGTHTTVGGTWLTRGVYAYVGSSHEPTLSAFVPPTAVLQRTMSLIPFIPASRWYAGDGAYSKAWRVNTIGDPLMLCGPKDAVLRNVLPATPSTTYQDVIEHANTTSIIAGKEPSDDTFAIAMNEQLMIGCDEAALTLWIDAMEHSTVGPKTARAALPVLFRKKQTDSFLWAFKNLDQPKWREKDMLWQLVGTSPSTPLRLLTQNLRRPYVYDDLVIIADRVARAGGTSAVRSIIDEELKRATGRNKRELTRLRKKYAR